MRPVPWWVAITPREEIIPSVPGTARGECPTAILRHARGKKIAEVGSGWCRVLIPGEPGGVSPRSGTTTCARNSSRGPRAAGSPRISRPSLLVERHAGRLAQLLVARAVVRAAQQAAGELAGTDWVALHLVEQRTARWNSTFACSSVSSLYSASTRR